jgi:hypothetical protein
LISHERDARHFPKISQGSASGHVKSGVAVILKKSWIIALTAITSNKNN